MNNYEKHQRDYTLLGSSFIANYFYNPGMADFFSYQPSPFYFLIEDNVFYHFFSKEDYAGLPQAYFKKYSKEEFFKFADEQEQELKEFREFMASEVRDDFDYLEKLHKYMQEFMRIIMISCYGPDYVKDLESDILGRCTVLRDKTEDVHRICMSRQREIFSKIEKERNLPAKSLEDLLESEYHHFVTTGELPEKIVERRNFFFDKISEKGDEIYSKAKAEEVLNEIDKTRNIDLNVDKIKGTIAFKGVATGKVIKIRNIEEADKVSKGDIIVTSMTDPRYLPAMKKAAAFVTDEGGMLCHAAIVAREMKKPCIIGTKIATKVLQDGDEVEVDAEKGVVKIIKKTK